MFKTDCDFCDELSNGVDNTFVRTYQQTAKNRIIFRSRNFVVLPSLGQIVEGYLLIVPVSHYTAIADMPADIKLEISELCDRVRFAQTKTYGPSLFFEHGIRGKESGGCGVEHAHLHAVPFTSASEPIEELKKNHCLKMIDSISELSQQVSPNSPYLYYEQTNGQAWVCETEHIPSQYVRKLLAQLIGTQSWDWRVSEREQALLSSITRLSGFFIGDSATERPTLDAKANQTALPAVA